MLNFLESFYDKRSMNCLYYMFIFAFWCSFWSLGVFCFLFFFTRFKYTPYYIWTPVGCCQWCVFLWSLGSFGSFNIILSSPSRPYQRWSVSDTPSSSDERRLFIHLDDYRPLLHASEWLFKQPNQMRGIFYFRDVRGY